MSTRPGEQVERSARTFERTWASAPGVAGWLAEVNNRPLGVRFMVSAFAFFLAGGVLALLMRVQLAVPDNDFLSPRTYNQLFTMHGSTMMYLFVVPFLEGLALWLLPGMLGSRDVAFPRLSAFSYWVYLFGGLIFYASFLFGSVPDAGWFAYTPLSGPQFTGLGVDFWLLGLGLVEIAGITAGAEILVTILKLRAPGMTLGRMPLFAWAMLVTSGMIVFAFPVLLTATVLLELDRSLSTRFFDVRHGGHSLLWQHLFWFFGHPEVYIAFLPATGVVSAVVATGARRPVAAYSLVVVAIVLMGFLSFGLWAHHMFTTGIPELALGFFTAASLMIGIASGIQVFAWIATLWGRRPRLTVPMAFVLGFLFLFVLGGVTGVMVAVMPFDLQVHDTYFLVAHFHYVLIGGVLFPIFAALFHWLPKITGRLLDPRLGHLSFWLTFAGFNLTFFPMHLMGLFGLPRRVYTYPPELEQAGYNLSATVGAFILASGALVFLLDFVLSLRRGPLAGPDPWGAGTLEWSVDSPPPPFGFRRPPVVRGREPLWMRRGERARTEPPVLKAVAALDAAPHEFRATLSTDPLTALPQAVQALPGPDLRPFVAACGLLVGSAGVLAKLHLVGLLGAAASAGALVAWLHPSKQRIELLRKSDVIERSGLPVFVSGARSTGWWGMLCTFAVLGTVLGALFFAYFYLRLFSSEWPQEGLPRPELPLAAAALLALFAAAGAQLLASRAFLGGSRRRARQWMLASLAAGLLFLALFTWELASQPFAPADNAYASVFLVTGWTLLALSLPALAFSSSSLLRLGAIEVGGSAPAALQVQLTSMYWVFAAAAAASVFAVLHLSPWVL